MGGGSLPDSPLVEGDFLRDFSCRCPGALEEETRRLMLEFYRGYLGQKPREQSPALRTMSRVVAGVILKHGIAYNANRREADERNKKREKRCAGIRRSRSLQEYMHFCGVVAGD